MPNSVVIFLRGRLRSFAFAFKGFTRLLSTEINFRIQFICGLAVCILGAVVGLSITEWMVQLLVIALVLVAEAINSAIERLADLISKERNKDIGSLKDIAAAAPLIAAIIAVCIGLLIYLPKIS